MTPYLSSSITRKRFRSRIFAFEGDESGVSSELSQEFEVFSVVSHMGQMDSGHYVTYLRLKDQWYKCHDAWITKLNDGVVKALQGYMMYYVQKTEKLKAVQRCASNNPANEEIEFLSLVTADSSFA